MIAVLARLGNRLGDNAFQHSALTDFVSLPFSILPLLGAGGGVASLLLARKAGRSLRSGEETGPLPEG